MINAFNKLKEVAPKIWNDKVTIQATKKVVNKNRNRCASRCDYYCY